jgi:hypothetical protein
MWKKWKQTQTKQQNRMLHDRAEKKLFVYANMELDKQASAFDPVYGKPGGSSDFEILKQMDIPQRGSRSTCQSILICAVCLCRGAGMDTIVVVCRSLQLRIRFSGHCLPC